MKSVILFTLLAGCNFRIDYSPTPEAYKSIASSKKHGAFLREYQPQSAYLKMAGNKYWIKEAWVEYTHMGHPFFDSITPNKALVVRFYYDTSYHTDLHGYVKEMGNDISSIWFHLPSEDFVDTNMTQVRDTLIMRYRETLDSAKKNKTFLLFNKAQ